MVEHKKDVLIYVYHKIENKIKRFELEAYGTSHKTPKRITTIDFKCLTECEKCKDAIREELNEIY